MSDPRINVHSSLTKSYGFGVDWELYQRGVEARGSVGWTVVFALAILSVFIVYHPFIWIAILFVSSIPKFYGSAWGGSMFRPFSHLWFIIKYTFLPVIVFCIINLIIIYGGEKITGVYAESLNFVPIMANINTFMGHFVHLIFIW